MYLGTAICPAVGILAYTTRPVFYSLQTILILTEFSISIMTFPPHSWLHRRGCSPNPDACLQFLELQVPSLYRTIFPFWQQRRHSQFNLNRACRLIPDFRGMPDGPLAVYWNDSFDLYCISSDFLFPVV